MESGCLAVSFCVEIYTCGVGFGYGFNLSSPYSCCFEFFSSWSSSSVPQRGVCWKIIPSRVLIVVPLASFFPSVRGLEFPFFHGGTVALLQSQWGSLGLCTVGGRPPSISKVVDCHLVEEVGFQCLDRRDVTLLQGGAV
jgi:hypothetical protein